MTKRFKRPIAFMLAVIMAMTLNITSGTSGIFDLVKTANAATITATQPTNGDGSSSSPYQIGTAGELLWFANQVNGGSTTANAVLTADIDLSGISNWTPIGNSDNKYAGTFDGKSYTIKNMSITEQGTNSGLFGYTSGATIKNIKITGNINLTTTSYTEAYGSIVGGASNTNITNCHSSVNVTINTTMTSGNCLGHIGGIVGQVIDPVGTVSNCSYSGTIELNDRPVNVAAGIAAYCSYNASPTIKNCSFTGAINSTNTEAMILGGILGYINSTSSVNLYNCLSAGTITKSGNTSTNGMIIGQIKNGYGNNCVKNNYYLSSTVSGVGSTSSNPTTTPATACTTDELKSGKIAYLLSQGTDGSVWGQDLSQDSLPMLYGNTVYYDESATPQYFNSSEATEPDEPQPDESQPKGDGSAENPYQIANYSNLVWFQQYVDSGNCSVNAVLTADITANENLLDENGEVSGTPEYTWTPISQNAETISKSYIGVFDGQGHTISGLYAPSISSADNCALFGKSKGTIKNIFITDSYFGGSGGCYYAASIVGEGWGCVIENCGSDAVVKGSSYCGGIAGEAYKGEITNCYFAGKINSTKETANAITSDYYGRGTLTNCYYLNTCGLTSNRATAKTVEEFASGEVCYKLNNGVTDGTQVWYQTIGTDSLPKFEGKAVGYDESKDPQYFNACGDDHQWSDTPTSTVEPTCTEDGYDIYTCTVCGFTKNVANGIKALGHSYGDDGVCTRCGAFTVVQPKEGDGSADNPYQIANYSNLVWFQQYVDSGNYSANAVLTADITANKNLLNENGEVSGTPEFTWIPITKSTNLTQYSGVFDGQGHTIRGLYVPSTNSDYCGLFGRANGTIKNIFITDSYFGSTNLYYVGAFVAYGFSSCVIENCGSDAVVVGSRYCGGIAGETSGTIKNCYFAGKISVGTSDGNAIVWDSFYDNATLKNCYYLDTCGLTSNRATAKTAEEFASGEVCYKLNNGVTDGTQVWYQTIGTDSLPQFVGKAVGYNESKDPKYFNACDDDHQWSEAPTSSVEPTCTEDGYDIYTCAVCGFTKNVPNGKTAFGHSIDDGICTVCGAFVATQPKNGDGTKDNPYQIANYGHLMWFQQYVDDGNYSANAVLTADITANENLLNASGEVSGTPEYTWTPISQSVNDSPTEYSGVFDGQGHTIRGLYVPSSNSDCCGLFGQANGTIKNIFITDSYFGGSIYTTASFVGRGYSNCVIENCGSDAVVEGYYYCGGIAGETEGKITSCYFAGKINSTSSLANAIASDYRNYGTLTNCYYLDTCGLTSERATSKIADEFKSGEVCYLLNNGVTDGTQTWYQTLTEDTLPKFEGKTVFYSEAASPQYFNAVLGDVSSSDTIDKADAALVLRYISSIGTLNAQQLAVADANGDGKVDMLDVVEILGLVG